MDSGVVAEIYEDYGAFHPSEGGFYYGCGWAGEGDDRAVVIGIQFAV
jgi:hypothetical protein